MCLARHNNHPTSLASSWDISFLKSLVQQDPKGSNKVAHLFILDVYVSPNRKYVNLSIIYYILDFSFFMSQDDAYFHIHKNDPCIACGIRSWRAGWYRGSELNMQHRRSQPWMSGLVRHQRARLINKILAGWHISLAKSSLVDNHNSFVQTSASQRNPNC